MRSLFKSTVLLLALSLPLATLAQSNETLTLHLNEGSLIVGQSVSNSFSLNTSLGRFDIPWEDTQKITFLNTNGSAKVDLNDESELQGIFTAKRVGVVSAFGKFFINRALIRQIDVGAHRFFGHVFSGDIPFVIPCHTLFSEQTMSPVTSLPKPIYSCTWTFWIRTTQTQLSGLLSKSQPGEILPYFWMNLSEPLDGGQPGGFYWSEHGTSGRINFRSTGAIPVNDGGWHHVAVVRDFNLKQIVFRIDNNAEAAIHNDAMLDIGSNDEPVFIGSHEGVCCFFEGELRDMRFYPMALTGIQNQQVIEGQFPPSNAFIVLFDTLVTLPSLPQ